MMGGSNVMPPTSNHLDQEEGSSEDIWDLDSHTVKRYSVIPTTPHFEYGNGASIGGMLGDHGKGGEGPLIWSEDDRFMPIMAAHSNNSNNNTNTISHNPNLLCTMGTSTLPRRCTPPLPITTSNPATPTTGNATSNAVTPSSVGSNHIGPESGSGNVQSTHLDGGENASNFFFDRSNSNEPQQQQQQQQQQQPSQQQPTMQDLTFSQQSCPPNNYSENMLSAPSDMYHVQYGSYDYGNMDEYNSTAVYGINAGNGTGYGGAQLGLNAGFTGNIDDDYSLMDKLNPQQKALDEHLAKHAGDKPYKCDVCPKQFNHKTDLRRHMCLHTGEKPFSCDVCGKGFIREDRMIKHSDTHKKKQPLMIQ
ncbi:hypothetical protein TCAL_06040 [Tigriopus californicus]|uniref:C2H2-type domain-containing protein n=1 Tax=Tigriopus californicus TaxID=6832 RepID=A0A553PQA2_TIGCA|nr:hypothetical protein TCAL_06040 [Tigriopus californicus]|eukprot:TCALIF_06040-PA protein Name:"Similar to ZNF75D Zinc finger protein 75D (Homo sapiens)" AED:0.47 eAED:0.86 QI:816/0/0.11/0.55/1/1/9/91/361